MLLREQQIAALLREYVLHYLRFMERPVHAAARYEPVREASGDELVPLRDLKTPRELSRHFRQRVLNEARPLYAA